MRAELAKLGRNKGEWFLQGSAFVHEDSLFFHYSHSFGNTCVVNVL